MYWYLVKTQGGGVYNAYLLIDDDICDVVRCSSAYEAEAIGDEWTQRIAMQGI